MFLLSIAQSLLMVSFSYSKAYGILNLDSSLAICHASKIWKNGIYLKDFNFYSSSLGIDCINFFAAGIYNLTAYLGFAMALCHRTAYLFTALLFYGINKQLHGTKEQFFVILLYFTPYSVEMLDWALMLSFSARQYRFSDTVNSFAQIHF